MRDTPGTPLLDTRMLGESTGVRDRLLDRHAMAHDASHYLLVPEVVLTPTDAAGVAEIMRSATEARTTVTFRSGGTSLSGQSVSDAVLVDTRRQFRGLEIGEGGATVRVQPGVTVRTVNTRLARHGRKLGPDPASEIACTIGGVIANNSSGMSSGSTLTSYHTVESLTLVLPSGTVVDTGAADADEQLRLAEPALHAGLLDLRRRLLADPDAAATVERMFAMKNTMGYGLNALLDFDTAVEILAHLVIGSEGTLAFVAEAVLRTVEVLPHVATGLLVFADVAAATAALPSLVEAGFATIELMDAASLRVAQQDAGAPTEITALEVVDHTALLVELQAASVDALAVSVDETAGLLASLPLTTPVALTTDAAARASLWKVRKGLYTAVAGARPAGTTALLEDVVVPVEALHDTVVELIALLERHGYDSSVIFGHAKDGNLHFLVNERFDDPESLARYRAFTEDLVDLILSRGGSLKAEHGTGRIMAPFVKRQYGETMHAMMWEIKRLIDPRGILNPGVVLTDDPDGYVRDLKLVPVVEDEVNRCVECGYCEPTCPSKDLTLTPRQRIALRRDITAAEDAGDNDLARALERDYSYDGVQTCAVDGLCQTACPVNINTGDLVRRLRKESAGTVENAAWSAASKAWGPVTRIGGVALDVAKAMPVGLVRGATNIGRAVLGADTVPQYQAGLPGGGSRRPSARADTGDAKGVFFAACINTMFGADEGVGATEAFLRLADRADVPLVIPEGLGSMCCGTPWKSKGMTSGAQVMSDRVIPALLEASDGGRLPIVCDAASCTEGLVVMAQNAGTPLRFVDATTFAREHILPALPEPATIGSVAIHHTCSTTTLGANDDVTALADFVADEVVLPDEWSCCAYAGDRGLLHPELTASATRREAAEITSRDFDAHVSANRTCEIGMTQATGRTYRHVLELVEEATRSA